MLQRWQGPVEKHRKVEGVRRVVVVGESDHGILEGEQRARVDVEGEVQVERAVARLLGVQLDLPRLAQRVCLDEMALFVDVEPVVDGVILEIGDEPGNVDDGQAGGLLQELTRPAYCAGAAWGSLPPTIPGVDDDEWLVLLCRAADAVGGALRGIPRWGLVPGSDSQHHSDVVADAAACDVLLGGGVLLHVLSEESGHSSAPGAGPQDPWVVVDPLDGSTNAAHGLGWYATSLCVVDGEGPRVALVRNLASDEEFTAVRGGGAWRDGVALGAVRRTERLADSLVLLSGLAGRHLGWRQHRVLGAVALDLCAVASGQVDGYLDCSVDAHGSWDYLGGMLVCTEAGVTVMDACGRDLVVLDHDARRTPVAGSAEVAEALRLGWPDAAGGGRAR